MNGMLARRSNSTTSLSRFFHELPDPDQSSLDFCNAFWGLNDCGVEVLFARMRGAARTMEELKGFWRERIAIEEDYAKRLAKLAKLPLGRDEIGDLRAALDVLRVETDKQASLHLSFGQNMRRDLEQPATDFIGKQNNHKKTFQATIEKSYKAKQTQEKYVEKAREKYEADCVHINSYTAQSTLLQGKELDKIHMKLERAQQTVQANERDYQNFARALGDTAKRWEGEWKTYCDQCQDLEDERIEFIKDNVWAYANAVSTVCVSDDEACEKVRVQLEQVEAEKDMENFVREYGTGPIIAEPPGFISYKASAPPGRPATKTANFLRSSIRAPAMRPPPSHAHQEEEPAGAGAAGIGAGGGGGNGRDSRASVKNAPPPANPVVLSSATPVGYQQTGASQASQSTAVQGRQTQDSRQQRDPGGAVEPKTMLSIGGNAYNVDPTADPQSARNFSGAVGDDKDPIAQALDALKKGGGVTRNGVGSVRSRAGASPAPMTSPGSRRTGLPAGTGPEPSRMRSVDYRDVANSIVGTHPSSRPTSPMSPPHAALMQGPTSTGGLGEIHQQAFPGERRLSISRGGPGPAQPTVRSPSPGRDGFAGIGAQGRASPQPFHQGPPQSQSRGPSPALGHGSMNAAYRSPSPSSFGIALDASGQVAHDSMAEEYARRSGQYNQQPPQQQYGQQGYANNQYNQSQQYQGHQGYQQPPQSQQQGQPAAYGSSYGTPPPAGPNGYSTSPAPAAAGPGGLPPSASYPQGYVSPQQLPPQTYGGPNGAQNQQPQQQRAPSPAAIRAPSPAVHPPSAGQGPPTGQFTEDGSGVLFYVKALYNYTATTPEEFDFQNDDIIAVTATPDDGWWSGVLLDDTRRVPGRTTFPSNFVCLF